MRKLNKKQKDIIIDYIESGYFDDDMLIQKGSNRIGLFAKLIKENDYETLYDDYGRLEWDLIYIDGREDKIEYVKRFE